MDYKLELTKILKHCIENRNYLMNSEGDIDKGARSTYQEIRVMIDEVLERALAEPSIVPQANELLPHVSGSLPTVQELKAKSYELYPRVAGDASESYRNSVQRNNWIQGAQYVRKLVGNDR